MLKTVYADYSLVAVSQATHFIIYNNLIVFLMENMGFFFATVKNVCNNNCYI